MLQGIRGVFAHKLIAMNSFISASLPTGYILSLVLLTLPRQHLVKLYLYVVTALLLYAGHQVSRYTTQNRVTHYCSIVKKQQRLTQEMYWFLQRWRHVRSTFLEVEHIVPLNLNNNERLGLMIS